MEEKPCPICGNWTHDDVGVIDDLKMKIRMLEGCSSELKQDLEQGEAKLAAIREIVNHHKKNILVWGGDTAGLIKKTALDDIEKILN